jgi:DNA-binding transcriptional ArsR family regulator
MERKSPVLDVLLPKTKQRLLSAILLQPERSWYLSQLARQLDVSPSSLQRELAQFVDAGILVKRQDGNRVYFQADQSCPIFRELSQILAKTAGLADLVRSALTPFQPAIQLAVLYGSIASSQEWSSSDVDLMIVGAITLADLAVPLRSLEQQLGRAVNPTIYTPGDFRKRIRDKNHFLTAVLQTDLFFLIGTSDDLARLVESPQTASSQNQPAGNPRSARRRATRPHRRKN